MYASAYYIDKQEKKINNLLEEIYQELEKSEGALDKINKLENILSYHTF